MTYKNFTSLTFSMLPEFKKSFTEDLDENYYNSFMGDLGLFIKKAILNKELFCDRYLEYINSVYNDNYFNNEFVNMIKINILEVLTDTFETQNSSLKIFTNHCYLDFRKLLNNSFTNLLEIDPDSEDL